MIKTRGDEQREKLRQQFWPNEDAWTGESEKGWFFAPRTLPLVLGLIASKELSGKSDATRVYLELWSRHMSGGVIEMKHEGDHSYAAGYFGNRGIRTWQERMKILEKNGFIKTKHIGNQRYRYVLLVHPTAAVQKLRDADRVSEQWLNTYCARQIEAKEPTYEERKKTKTASKVVTMKAPKATQKKASAS
ncbi:MAG: hypothetical protein HYS38_03440 [Acidobacteria bacterium]|nr:hypothetical protein [Acidobacteriota bacterium]